VAASVHAACKDFAYKKNYALGGTRGVDYFYNAPTLATTEVYLSNTTYDNVPTGYTKAQGIQYCKDACDINVFCRSVAWVNTTGYDSYTQSCVLSAVPYSEKNWLFEHFDYGENVESVAYATTNFKIPDEPIINGGFETGCFAPWVADQYPAHDNVTAVVVKCKQADKCPEDYTYYAHLYGTPNSVDLSGIGIATAAIVTNNTKYAVSFWAQGTIGQLALPFSDEYVNATGKWKQYKSNQILQYSNIISFYATYDPPRSKVHKGPFDWKITGLTVFEA
jgi:hypothetical protein